MEVLEYDIIVFVELAQIVCAIYNIYVREFREQYIYPMYEVRKSNEKIQKHSAPNY